MHFIYQHEINIGIYHSFTLKLKVGDVANSKLGNAKTKLGDVNAWTRWQKIETESMAYREPTSENWLSEKPVA